MKTTTIKSQYYHEAQCTRIPTLQNNSEHDTQSHIKQVYGFHKFNGLHFLLNSFTLFIFVRYNFFYSLRVSNYFEYFFKFRQLFCGFPRVNIKFVA